jgi:hypothetical protein
MKKTEENKIILYQDDNGITNVSVRFADEDLWLTQKQLAEIYDTTQQNVSQHIDGIIQDGELFEEATHKKFLLVQTEGSRQVKREIDHYNLDMIIAIGYRVQSQIATRFRRWATNRLHEYIQKGFALDDERLKQGGSRYFRELLQRIRDIRSSERNFYREKYRTTKQSKKQKKSLKFTAKEKCGSWKAISTVPSNNYLKNKLNGTKQESYARTTKHSLNQDLQDSKINRIKEEMKLAVVLL